MTWWPFGKKKHEVPAPDKKQTRVYRRKTVDIAAAVGVPRGSDEDVDPFTAAYECANVLRPPFPPERLWRLAEQCDTLSACAEAMATNAERPHFLEENPAFPTDEDSHARNHRHLADFLEWVNGKDSWEAMRRDLRRDLSVTGNAFLEVLRDRTARVDRLYHISNKWMRLSQPDTVPLAVPAVLPRQGELRETTIWRYFRRFARVRNGQSGSETTWFKEFGDPRVLHRHTGEYDPHTPPEDRATELWWFRRKVGGDAYGIPEWISTILDVEARWLAKWANLNVIDNGAVGPFAVLVSGGKLTEDAMEDLYEVLISETDATRWAQPLILQAEPDSIPSFDRGASVANTKIELKSLRDANNHDLLFERYLAFLAVAIRSVFRLPPCYLGETSGASDASIASQIEIAETQIFEPLRREFDEEINTRLLQQEWRIFDWKFRTRRPRVTNPETVYKTVGVGIRGGAVCANQVVDVMNDVLGTNWPAFANPILAKLPVNLIQLGLRNGLLTIRPDGEIITTDGPPE